MFGSFSVTREGKEATFRTKKTAGLFAYLAFYRGQRVSKDLLVDALWADADADKGRHSLRMALSSLRSTFESPGWDPSHHIFSERETIELSEAGFETDVSEFRRLVRESDGRLENLDQAVELYAGPFLPSFSDDWILPQALELEELYAQAVCELTGLLTRTGDVKGAVSRGRRAISLCPNREDLHVAVMRAYADSGQSGLALKQFEELEKMLDDVWGESPGDEANEVLDSLPRRPTGGNRPVILAPTPIELESHKTTFFGRERELAHLNELFSSDVRMVTLVGLGGSGKTRLAQKLAQETMDAMENRVWFVSLVGIEEPSQLQEAILSSLDWQPTSGFDTLSAIAERIGSEPAMLILDNLEQVTTDARFAIQSLMSQCPGLRVLATSRVPIDASGERLFPVNPLELPSDFRDLASLRNAPSVQLLIDAAQGVRPGFGVTPANAQSVLLLCQRLEGIPLAIELAAAKLGTLTPAQVIASIARRVDLGTNRPAFREQHRSLRAVVEWSLGLLTDRERTSFARLGVCRGGFNHGLAMALLGEGAEQDVAQLCRYSLVGWSESVEEVRFEMLETVREMSQGLLEADEELRLDAWRKHFDFMRALCADPRQVTDVSAWVASLSTDAGNVFAAIETATALVVDPEAAWELALPLEAFTDRTGRSQVWIAPLEGLLEATQADLKPETLARAHALLAALHYGRREIRPTFDHYMAAIEAADMTEDAVLKIDLRTNSISAAITIGAFDDAERLLGESIKLLEKTEDKKAAVLCYLNRAWVIFDRGHEEESEPDFQKALELAEGAGDLQTLGYALTGLACGVGHQRYDEAQPIFDRALATWRGIEMVSRVAHCLYYRGMIDYRHGHLQRSLENIRTSLRMYIENDIALGQSSMSIAGTTLAALGFYREAALSWGRSEEARRRQNMQPIPCLQRDVDREMPAVLAGISQEEFDAAFRLGGQLSASEFVDSLFGPRAS